MEYSVVEQQADIQREIEMNSPMFSELLSLAELELEYAANPNFLKKFPV